MKLLSFLVLILFIYIQNVNSQISVPVTGGPITAPPIDFTAMNSNDKTCVNQLLQSLGITTYTANSDYCDLYPNNFVCNSTNGNLISFNIIGIGQGFLDSSMNIDYSSLNCFTNSPLPSGYFSQINVQSGIWSSKIALSEIVFDDCVFENILQVVYFKGSLTIYPKSLNSFNTINLYFFKNLKKFVFINYYNLPASIYNYRILNVVDLTTQSNIPELIKVQVLDMGTSMTLSFSNFKIKRLELISNNYVTSDGGSYITTMKQIEELSLTATTTAFLPTSLFSNFDSTFKKLELNIPLTSNDDQLIDFQYLPTVDTFILSNPGTLETTSNIYKFVSFGNVKTLIFNNVPNLNSVFITLLNNMESLTFINSQFSLSLSLITTLPRLKNLKIDSTSGLSGPLTNDVCFFNSLVVKDSNIVGSLPSCVYCYISATNEDFRGNVFDNYKASDSYQVPECTSIIPKFKSEDLGKIYLQGEDLGFTSDAFTTDPKLDFFVDVPSVSFYTTQISYSGIVNVNFIIPNKNFTLDTSFSVPRVDSILISSLNNGVITISGYYFTYAPNDVTVTVGNENCNIISSTFYEIICQINNYDPFLLNVPSTVQVENLFTSIPITLSSGFINLYKNCSQDCNQQANSQCSRFTGTCIPIISFNSVVMSVNNPSKVTFIIKGYFGTTQGDLALYIGDASCQITSFSSSSVICNSPFNSQQGLSLYAIQNNYKSSPFSITMSISYCPSNCTDQTHGSCNYNSGLCTCFENYALPDCNYSYPKITSIKASNELGGEFIINGAFGIIGPDFKVLIGGKEVLLSVKNETTIIGTAEPGVGTVALSITNNNLILNYTQGYTYTFDCIDIGGCNNGKCIHMNKCSCNTDYYGSVCLLKQHYVSSLIPTTINGGTVIAFGDFGNTHENLEVLVGSESCLNPKINSTSLECSIGAGSGIKSFTVKQNDLTWTRNNYFNYINPIKSCPSNCTSKNNGVCDTNSGECKCIENKWTGYDCSIPIKDNEGGNNNEQTPVSTSTIDKETGITQIQNQNTKFNISIIKILEISITDQSVVSQYELKQVWDSYESKTTSDGNNLYIFNQSLSTENSNIVYKIEEVKNTKSFEFADLKYTVPSDSIKITIEINNYPFFSVLNVLQLQMLSSVEKNEIQDNSCNQKDSNSEIQDGSDTTSFVKISINSKILYGRFITKVLSDNRPTFISSEIVSKNSDSIIVGLNLPHAENIVIDPDFSVLLSSDFKSSCGSSNKSTIIAVAVVVPVVVVSALVIGGAIIYKKNRIKIRVKTMKLRTFK